MAGAPHRVVFRADAGHQIGSGHVMRCLTLADALKARGTDVHFVTRAHPGHLAAEIVRRGHRVHLLPVGGTPQPPAVGRYTDWLGASSTDDAQQCRDVVAQVGPADRIVADHYAIGADWERALAGVAPVAALDDLADRDHVADLVIDQNPVHTVGDYRPHVPPHCRLLIGTAYALLRPPFVRERARVLATRTRRAVAGNLLVALGGTDPGNVTGAVVRAVAADLRRLRIDVVLGATAPHRDAVARLVSQLPHAQLHVGVDAEAMVDLMAAADVAVGAAGSSSWERCCLGLPTVLLVLAENQREVGGWMGRRGAALPVALDPEDGFGDRLKAGLVSLLKDGGMRASMTAAAADICDGGGVARVVAALCGEAA